MKNAIHSQLTNFLNKKKKKRKNNPLSEFHFISNLTTRKRKGRCKLIIIIITAIRRSGEQRISRMQSQGINRDRKFAISRGEIIRQLVDLQRQVCNNRSFFFSKKVVKHLPLDRPLQYPFHSNPPPTTRHRRRPIAPQPVSDSPPPPRYFISGINPIL